MKKNNYYFIFVFAVALISGFLSGCYEESGGNGGGSDVTASGQASRTPWSGWWWPFYTGELYHLYDDNGPMEKYDNVVKGRESAKDWELKNHYTTDWKEQWFGHCNGWASASILTEEPKGSLTVESIEFRRGDRTGILTEWYNKATTADWVGHRYEDFPDDPNDPYPQEFHKALIRIIGENKTALVMDTCGGDRSDASSVWNYPAFKYEMSYQQDLLDSQKLHVTCKVTFVSNNVASPDATASPFTKIYYYIINDKKNPTTGEWESDSVYDHPDFLWTTGKQTCHNVLEDEYVEKLSGVKLP